MSKVGERGGRLHWRGLIREYADFLPVDPSGTVVTLGEGATPLIHAPSLGKVVGANVYLKFEGANPTG